MNSSISDTVKDSLYEASSSERSYWDGADNHTKSILIEAYSSENAYQQDYEAKHDQIINSNYDSLSEAIKETIKESLIAQGELPDPSDYSGIGLEFIANPYGVEKEVYVECDRCDEVFMATEDFEQHKTIDHGDSTENYIQAEEQYELTMNPDISLEALRKMRAVLAEGTQKDLYHNSLFNYKEIKTPTLLEPKSDGLVGYNDNPNAGLYDTKKFKVGTSKNRDSGLEAKLDPKTTDSTVCVLCGMDIENHSNPHTSYRGSHGNAPETDHYFLGGNIEYGLDKYGEGYEPSSQFYDVDEDAGVIKKLNLDGFKESYAGEVGQDEVNIYLDGLRESGVTNMFGAGSYLYLEFGISEDESREFISEWMKTFGARHPKGESYEGKYDDKLRNMIKDHPEYKKGGVKFVDVAEGYEDDMVDYDQDGVSDIKNVLPEPESDPAKSLKDVDFSEETIDYIYPTKSNEAFVEEKDPFLDGYGDDDIESDRDAVEAQIISRKMGGYSDESIARELSMQYGISPEEALEKSYSIEVSVNDRVSNTFFGKRYNECSESEKAELRMYGGSD